MTDIVKRIYNKCLGKNDSTSNLAKKAADEIVRLRQLLACKPVYEPIPYYLNPDFKMPSVT